jgi:hypothetical protein
VRWGADAMQIQWFATFGVLAMAGAFVLAGRAESAGYGSTSLGAGRHHGRGMHFMALDSDIADAVEAGWEGRDDNLHDASRYSGDLHVAFNDAPAQPYMTTYIDEAAQRLGLRAGHFDLISVPLAQGGSYGLSVSGMGRGHSLLNLQWHLGP